MNFHQLSGNLFIVLLTIVHFTFGDHTTELQSNYNLSFQNESIRDSNITWIKIATITPSNHTNCTIDVSSEDQNLDIANTSRRKRRKRRRNKYKSNQRRPSDSYKKHSTRVQLDKPVQFLIPPDYQENLIPKDTNYKNRDEKFQKIAPPVRYLLPPFFDPSFSVQSTTPREPKKQKYIEPPNTTNRGSTKFKHTIYYSDSGNEILNEITTPSSRTEPTRNFKPIIVQPTPLQYSEPPQNISNYMPYRDTHQNHLNLVSYEVANAGMQVINMSSYQKQSQLVPPSNYKQSASPHQQQTQPQQYQPYQQLQPPLLSDQHLPIQTYNQHTQQNYQTAYSRPPEITTTPVIDTNTTQKPDNFKGLDLAESKYFSDLPSEQEFAAQNDQVIPGTAGKDYPVLDQGRLQKRRFACRGLEGYFADTSSRCQVFYICNGDGAGEPMLCPNGTLFSQELLVCDWWYNVDC